VACDRLTLDSVRVMFSVMKRVNALEMRQSVGKVLRQLEKGGEPVMIERRRRPAAVLISLEDYQKRFADHDADEKRVDIVRRIRELQFKALSGKTTLDLLRDLRS
jgi:prevent-host-death family protein